MKPAVHRTVLAVDVAGFSDQGRSDRDRVAVRDGLYSALVSAFRVCGIPWEAGHHEDRGDGVLVLTPPDVVKGLFTEVLPDALLAEVRAHNAGRGAAERMRLRVAVHAGEVQFDDHGVVGAAVNHTFRLLDAPPVKAALAESASPLVLVVSDWFHDEVVRHSPASEPDAFRRVRFTVKETTGTAWVRVPGEPRPALDGAAPRQLPAHTPQFSGRRAELGALDVLLDDTPTVVIDGMAGVGKTALALHWAHRNAGRFPDGQLYVNLRGVDPLSPPLLHAEAVRGFLDALGVPPDSIPVDLHAQAALYRSRVATRRMLIVLDNAADAEHVRPLLPGGDSPSRVVVTSRDRLTSLVTEEGAHAVPLVVPDGEEAEALLALRLGGQRAAAEPEAVRLLVERCGRLPLALAVTAARAGAVPHVPLRDLADELGDEQDRLDVLDAGDPRTSLRAVFSWSYRTLPAPAARLFRLLGVAPGPDTGLPAAASLIGADVSSTRRVAAELTRAHLLEEHTPGRFRCHDLLRAYAAELAEEDPVDRDAAVLRVLDHYLHTGFAASLAIEPFRHPVALAPPVQGAVVRPIASRREAAAWFTAEYACVLAAVDRAATTGLDVHAWQLPWTFTSFLYWYGHWHDLVACLGTAMAATRRLGDAAARAVTHRLLGNAYSDLGRRDESLAELARAARTFHEIGDVEGEAFARYSMAVVLDRFGMPAEAIDRAHEALELYQRTGNRTVEARTLSAIGWFEARLGHYDHALEQCGRALELLQALGDRQGEADTLNSMGFAKAGLGLHDEAVAHHRRALELWQESGNDSHRAKTLTQLGDIHRAAGDVRAAREAWRQALDTFEALGDPAADDLRAKLEGG
ncbi:ATP-binding protein [Saccharothrix luteola]|uniref:ATP-binding protein n=1 Tax=Saccharothrix luteola TaxID=2893018 RepID=UPI001E2B2C2C|nr:tetratricopeptide repeat protein [Saccharothrix luteola]MCC8250826.1 tetratricopeptide repeat protein [Saccharothrix luteola]